MTRCILYKRMPTTAEAGHTWVLRKVDTLDMMGHPFTSEADARMYALMNDIDIVTREDRSIRVTYKT